MHQDRGSMASSIIRRFTVAGAFDSEAGLRALAPRQPPPLVFKWVNSISRESFVYAVFLGVTREANIRRSCCCLVVVWLRQ